MTTTIVSAILQRIRYVLLYIRVLDTDARIFKSQKFLAQFPLDPIARKLDHNENNNTSYNTTQELVVSCRAENLFNWTDAQNIYIFKIQSWSFIYKFLARKLVMKDIERGVNVILGTTVYTTTGTEFGGWALFN